MPEILKIDKKRIKLSQKTGVFLLKSKIICIFVP